MPGAIFQTACGALSKRWKKFAAMRASSKTINEALSLQSIERFRYGEAVDGEFGYKSCFLERRAGL